MSKKKNLKLALKEAIERSIKNQQEVIKAIAAKDELVKMKS